MTEDPRDGISTPIEEARVRLDEALAALEALPALDRDSLGFAAHALSNYLTVCSGTVDLLTKRLATGDTTEMERWLHALKRTTDLMTHTVHQLMGTAASGAPALVCQPQDLVLLVTRVCAYYDGRATRKGTRVVMIPPRSLPFVLGDPVAIAAALDSLLSNAVKFSPPGSQVTVALCEQSDELICTVQDQGPGIDAEDRARLFQRGARLKARPTAGELSTGYGLAVARELIEKQGGRIWCDSEPGEGARFAFALPSAPVAGADGPPAH